MKLLLSVLFFLLFILAVVLLIAGQLASLMFKALIPGVALILVGGFLLTVITKFKSRK